MNINPSAKQILFYGDSLIFGKKPVVPERFLSNVRFTGVAQGELGEDFNIIEEGLRARNLFGENTFFAERNGLEQFGAIFASHIPLDLVVIMLGSNDCNLTSNKTKEEFFVALDEYRNKINSFCTQFAITNLPKLLIVLPPLIKGEEVVKDAKMLSIFGEVSEEKSKNVINYLMEYCKTNNIDVLDSNESCKTALGEGIHLDEENNEKLGKALAEKIKSLF